MSIDLKSYKLNISFLFCCLRLCFALARFIRALWNSGSRARARGFALRASETDSYGFNMAGDARDVRIEERLKIKIGTWTLI